MNGITFQKDDLNRRKVLKRLGLISGGLAMAPFSFGASKDPDEQSWQLEYIVASCMYGTLDLETILEEVPKTNASAIDIWPRPHGNQREQMEAMGHEQFAGLLQKYGVRLGILTHYDLGPFSLQSEMRVAKKLGGRMVISGSGGPGGLKGKELKGAIRGFFEKMKPHISVAEELGITIGIENHGHALVNSPDSIRYFAELAPSENIGISLAPYHLPQEPELIASLIAELGEKLVHFYAWQHGKGAMKKRPKSEEMKQLPGYGSLDFEPIVRAMGRIPYHRWTSIFMHPVPRGVPILPSAAEVTKTINRSRAYLAECARKI